MTLTAAIDVGDVPPAPVHVTEYVVFAVGETVADPEVPVAVKPEPVHEVALVELQESVAEEPAVIEVGDAESDAVGAEGGGGTGEPTATPARGVTDPPAPVHVRVYVGVAVGVTDCVPLVALVPVQPLLAVHEVAFVELHESVADPPVVIEVGFADRVAVGGVGGNVTDETVTVALAAGDVPPAPVQVTEYVAVAVGETVTDPDVPEAVKPEPVQLVAFVELQVSVAEEPVVIEVGLAERVAVGVVGDGGGVETLVRRPCVLQPSTPES